MTLYSFSFVEHCHYRSHSILGLRGFWNKNNHPVLQIPVGTPQHFYNQNQNNNYYTVAKF